MVYLKDQATTLETRLLSKKHIFTFLYFVYWLVLYNENDISIYVINNDFCHSKLIETSLADNHD
jgi:hypothetical protein